jgi:L-aspartate oxidase
VPAAHYSCGGLVTDDYARTDIPRLYAVGEVASTGVHGANRLASNSLLEAVVFAERAAASASEWNAPAGSLHSEPFKGGDKEPDVEHIQALTYRMRSTMWQHIGIVRSNASLEKAEQELSEIYQETEKVYRESRLYGALIELRNMVTVSLLVVRCARMRKESRGLHFNQDYPNLDPAGPRHSVLDLRSSPLPLTAEGRGQ